MSSAAEPEPRFTDPDRTARARIRDAAIVRFAADGIAATSLKSIAATAGVSPPLVIHHFGSKEGLRHACDEHVVALIRERKRAAMAAGPGLDPLQAIREASDEGPLLAYLARTVTDGSPHVARLIDEMVDDAVAYIEEGVRSGLLKPSDRPRERAVVLMLWSVGALVLHEHAKRLLGVDLTGSVEDLVAWIVPASEILARGILREEAYERLRDAVQAVEPAGNRADRTGP